jgi:hypothetical protein
MCVYETVDGILDMPEFQVTRGGIRWTPGPDFSDIYDACGFHLTEAEAIAGTATKTCCSVECPAFDELRMDAVGLCIEAPLLTLAAYPELVRRFTEGALVAHQHKVNARVLGWIDAAAGTALVAAGNADSINQALQVLDLQAVAMRYSYRMAQNQSIEVVIPFWYKALIRMDWGLQALPREVSDAAINKWFNDRNLAVQWVYDYQNLAVAATGAVTIPATVNVLMYPAGTWARGRADVINIDAVYDSTNLASNVFTSLFMEEGIMAVQRCTRTNKITLATCASGRVAAQDISECLTIPIVAGGAAARITAPADAAVDPESAAKRQAIARQLEAKAQAKAADKE